MSSVFGDVQKVDVHYAEVKVDLIFILYLLVGFYFSENGPGTSIN